MSSIPKIKADMRFKTVKTTYQKARVNFEENYMFNHSLHGEKPCEERIHDFAVMAAYIQTAIKKGVEDTNFSWTSKYHFPSNQVGTLTDLVNCYRYGWEILHDLGLFNPIDDEDFVNYEEELD